MESGHTIEDRLKVKTGAEWAHYRGQAKGQDWWSVATLLRKR